ncbi:MAG: arylamine N-acetyltransferase [Ekhidna sp.]
MRLNYFHNKPKAARIDVNAYLQRIAEKRETPSLHYLKSLHRSHLIHIPFENLDIHYKQRIVLDYQKVYQKVIERGRGGFCYELNGLFYLLLANLGFECHLISAQVKSKETGEFGKPFDHMAVVVRLEDQEWLVDVGFGANGIITPKKIEKNTVQMDYTRYWRFITDPDENLLLQVSDDTSTFSTMQKMTTDEKQVIEFYGMCEYHQTSPASPFTQKKIATRLTPEGRIILTDRVLKILELGTSREIPILNEDEFLSKLQQHFGISLHQLIPRENG